MSEDPLKYLVSVGDKQGVLFLKSRLIDYMALATNNYEEIGKKSNRDSCNAAEKILGIYSTMTKYIVVASHANKEFIPILNKIREQSKLHIETALDVEGAKFSSYAKYDVPELLEYSIAMSLLQLGDKSMVPIIKENLYGLSKAYKYNFFRRLARFEDHRLNWHRLNYLGISFMMGYKTGEMGDGHTFFDETLNDFKLKQGFFTAESVIWVAELLQENNDNYGVNRIKELLPEIVSKLIKDSKEEPFDFFNTYLKPIIPLMRNELRSEYGKKLIPIYRKYLFHEKNTDDSTVAEIILLLL